MDFKVKTLILTILFIIASCAPVPAPTLTSTMTNTPILTSTPIPTSTVQPTPTITWVTLGSPFASDCGDGVPVVWSNDSFNGPFLVDRIGVHWGHMDMLVPEGCNIDNYLGEVAAPVTGTVSTYDYGDPLRIGYKIELPRGIYLDGIAEVFHFSGLNEFALSKVSKIEIDIGHLDPAKAKIGKVSIGDSIGDIVRDQGPSQAIGYQIFIFYDGTEYMFSPTLFPTTLSDGTVLRPMLDGISTNWTCANDSYAKNFPNQIYDCIPEPHDYAP